MGHGDRTGFLSWEWFMVLDRFNPLKWIGMATDQVSVLSDLCRCQTASLSVEAIPHCNLTISGCRCLRLSLSRLLSPVHHRNPRRPSPQCCRLRLSSPVTARSTLTGFRRHPATLNGVIFSAHLQTAAVFKREMIGRQNAIIVNLFLGANPRNETTNLKNHVLHYCKRIKLANARQSTIAESLGKHARNTSDAFVFDPAYIRLLIAKAICMHEYPLSFVEHVGMKAVYASMQPTFNVPS
ncbi:hypothetical protein PIB30_024682 [Stylosanthes scabra]|uniref:Uncharacterized protein n=1 Tax=Stylosanthes scabra TaxID=79078 RepID=A0ABU6Z8C9_9FABA|nr:hypothetical protein [Stylosanthes scabra]